MIVFILFEVLFFGFLLAADLVSKHFIMPFLEANGDYVLINKVLTLTPAYNEGAGFSFLSGKTAALIAITCIGLAVILGLLIFGHIKLDLKNKRVRFLLSILVMMLAGGLGNLVDRCAFGHVRDFIDYTVVYTIFKRNFAVCNVADIWLTVGMVLLIIFVIFLWKGNLFKGAEVVPDDTNAKTAARLLAKMEEQDLQVGVDNQDVQSRDAQETEVSNEGSVIQSESGDYTDSTAVETEIEKNTVDCTKDTGDDAAAVDVVEPIGATDDNPQEQ